MKDGKVISGKVVSQNLGNIELRTEKGSLWLSKKQIKSIKYHPLTEEQKKARSEALRKKREELKAAKIAARLKIEQEAKEKSEKERLLKELEEKERQEATAIAQEKARRAEALRELVANKTMEKPADEPISYWDFAWRSMVLPGWGHFYLDKPTMGAVYSGTAIFLVVNLYQRRQDALIAKEKNYKEVYNNYILTAFPELAPQSLRYAYSYEANRRAFKNSEYDKKVQIYNYSLYLLGAFYGAQLAHIIYNGIAWENGLPIVERTREKSEKMHFMAFALPESSSKDGKSGYTGFVAGTIRF